MAARITAETGQDHLFLESSNSASISLALPAPAQQNTSHTLFRTSRYIARNFETTTR
jgi:hypothetical protein